MSDIKLPEVKTPLNLGTGRRKTAVARVRLSVGTEDIRDILADLEQAISASQQ